MCRDYDLQQLGIVAFLEQTTSAVPNHRFFLPREIFSELQPSHKKESHKLEVLDSLKHIFCNSISFSTAFRASWFTTFSTVSCLLSNLSNNWPASVKLLLDRGGSAFSIRRLSRNDNNFVKKRRLLFI